MFNYLLDINFSMIIQIKKKRESSNNNIFYPSKNFKHNF
jgi:hypothetical protein